MDKSYFLNLFLRVLCSKDCLLKLQNCRLAALPFQQCFGSLAHTPVHMYCICHLCCQDWSLFHGTQVSELQLPLCTKTVNFNSISVEFFAFKFINFAIHFARKPYEIKTIINIYNIYQVIANVLLAYGYWVTGWGTYYNWCKYNLYQQ